MNNKIFFPYVIENYNFKKRNLLYSKAKHHSGNHSEYSNSSIVTSSDSLILKSLIKNHKFKKTREKFFFQRNNSIEKNSESLYNIFFYDLKKKVKNLFPKLNLKANSINVKTDKTIDKKDNYSYSIPNFKIPTTITQEINNELFSNKIIPPNKFGKLCIKLNYMKNIIKFNKDIYKEKEKKKNKDEKEMNEEIKYLKKKNDIINNIISNYRSYIVFLRDYNKNEEIILDNLKIKQSNLLDKIRILEKKINEKMYKYQKYIRFRNLLICIKENIQFDKLPPEFYDNSYETLIKNKKRFHSTIKVKRYSFNKKEIFDRKSILRLLSFTPQSIFNLNKNEENYLDKNNKNEKKKKVDLEFYLDYHNIIFESSREINEQFYKKEKTIVKLYQKYYLNYSLIENLKKEYEKLIKKEINNNIDYNDKKKNYKDLIIKLKESNLKLIKRKKFLETSLKIEINRDLKYFIFKIEKNKLPIDDSLSILKLNNYYKIKNFKIEFAYVYFYIALITKNLYVNNKNLFYKANFCFTEKKLFDMLNILENQEKFKKNEIIENAISVLEIYDKVVTMIINNYKSLTSNINIKNNNVNLIKRRKLKTMEKQKSLNETIKIQQYKKLIDKHNKTIYISRSKSDYNFRVDNKKTLNNNNDKNIDYDDLLKYHS